MDAEDMPLNAMEGMSDAEEGEAEERRRRRDFVGTELERPKKGSRAPTKKRKRAGLTLMDDKETSASNSTMDTEVAPRTWAVGRSRSESHISVSISLWNEMLADPMWHNKMLTDNLYVFYYLFAVQRRRRRRQDRWE